MRQGILGAEKMRNEQLILVAESSAVTRRVIGNYLRRTDYEVAVYAKGEEVLKRAEQEQPVLILLDVTLPDMDGFEFMRRLKSRAVHDTPVIVMTWDSGVVEQCLEAGATDFIIKPFAAEGMLRRVRLTMELENYHRHLEWLVREQLDHITSLQNDLIISMANMIDRRDKTTGNHIRNTSSYMTYLVERMRKKKMYPEILTAKYATDLCQAAPMHDLGKIAVSDLILQKPGPLTEEEFALMKDHAREGGRMIKESLSGFGDRAFVQIAADMAAHHHEKFDGSGYPDHLKGTDIPFPARLMAVVDIFDALTSERQYKSAFSYEKSAEILMEYRGTALQADIVDVFLEDPVSLQALMKKIKENE